MAFERHLPAVAPILLTANGAAHGLLQLADTRGLKVKQKIVLSGVSLPQVYVEIKRVLSSTTLIVGLPTKPITDRTFDASAYTTALSSFIYAEEQDKPKVPQNDQFVSVYETEPTDAWRVIPVDQLGDYYGLTNPLPVQDVGETLSLDPVIVNPPAPLANTEYSFTFPPRTVRFTIAVRDGYAKMQISYNPTESGTVFRTVNMGNDYSAEAQMGNKTIYFQVNRPNKIIEIEYWKQP